MSKPTKSHTGPLHPIYAVHAFDNLLSAVEPTTNRSH